MLVEFSEPAPLALITLNRPERHNSLVPALLEQLLAHLETIRTRSDLKAVVLQANGRSFSTGGDLQGFADHLDDLEAYSRDLVGLLNRCILAMLALPQPVVAAAHGIVTGGSIGLLLASDIVLLAPGAGITPFYSVVGFSPDGGWTALLPDLIGLRRTSEILLANQTITADQALSWGLANRIVPADGIRAETLALARALADRPAASIRQIKRLLNETLPTTAAGLEAEREQFVKTILTLETQASMLAFLDSLSQKRSSADL